MTKLGDIPIGDVRDALNGVMPTVLKDIGAFQQNHRFVLIQSCAFAELLCSILIDASCKHAAEINERSRDYPFSVKLTLLNELDVISDEMYSYLNWLRKQRNDAAHSATFVFNPDTIPNCDWARDHKDHLWFVCSILLGMFWASHQDVFAAALPNYIE
jgi:hypothetical protein